jgi:hypothetical protein
MGFLAPWFLAGLAAVGLPIWIHLLKRHKTDPTPFPSLMFFEQREQSSVKHRRLEYLLLWALRMAMVILLALLFANPFIRRAIPLSDSKKLTVIAIDRSFSMRAGDRMAKAKEQAQQVVGSLGPGAQALVLALGAQVQTLTQATADPGELRAAINSIQPSDSRASFGELARYARTLSESLRMPLEVHLVSDLQRTALPPGFGDLRLDPDTTLIFHRAGDAAANWTVENVAAPQRIYDPKKVRIQATVAGFGAPAAKRTVSLALNNKVLQTKTVDVPAGGRAQVEFLALEAPYGFSKGEVRIDSADLLAADDRFPFAVERADPRKVLFLDTGRHPRAELYYRSALDASADAAFVLETMRPEQAASVPLTNYAFVVLSDVGSIPPGLEDALRRYVNAGGSVLVALGPASAVLPRVPILDESIEASRYAGREAERFLTVSDLDAGHPALRSAGRFEAVKFYQAIHVTPSKSHVLARLNDQTPLLLERQIGEGKVLAFTSTFDNEANDLPIHAAWVPFIQQTAAYLSGGSGADQPVNLPVDSYVELRTGLGAANKAGAAAEVLDPDGKRLLSLEEEVSAQNFAVTREGFFELKAANGRRILIAAHADRRESDLAVIPQETLDLWNATGKGDQSGGAPSTQEGAGDKKPWGLWPIMLLLLLGVAMAESVVANRYLRPPVERQTGTGKEAA